MNYDSIINGMSFARKRGVLAWLIPTAVLVFLLTLPVYLREFRYEGADLYVHTMIACDFDFTDLHSITCRLSYPVWHVLVSALYQLGMPARYAAAGVFSLMKMLTFALTYLLVGAMAGERAKPGVVTGTSLFLMVVTGIHLPPYSLNIYRGVGSPTVWHNPTQQTVTVAMLMVMPWLAHCWYQFERQLDAGREHVMIPWRDVAVLAILTTGSVACKPTFLQALLPAAFVMYLVEVFRHRGEWRYFGQIVLGFLPSAGYFLLSYLYYTGVVVEYTSGVEIGITAETAIVAIRSAVMMSLCPLLTLAACWRKGMFKDRMLVLALLMVAFSALEAMAFRETGQRAGHGNFTWAANGSSFFLWVVMSGTGLRCFTQDVREGMAAWRKGAYALAGAAFLWHAASGIYYLFFLMTTNYAF